MTDATDVVREIEQYVKAGHRQMCRVGQGDYPHKKHPEEGEFCVPGHAIIDALRDIALRLAKELRRQKWASSDCSDMNLDFKAACDEVARLKTEYVFPKKLVAVVLLQLQHLVQS